MTTNKELQEWLKRFPDDVLIQVITSEEAKWAWETYVEAYHVHLVLPDVTMKTLKGWENFTNVVFDVKYDYDKECATAVNCITLGKAHND